MSGLSTFATWEQTCKRIANTIFLFYHGFKGVLASWSGPHDKANELTPTTTWNHGAVLRVALDTILCQKDFSMPVLSPVTIAKAQLPLFKQEANLCCELISKFTHSKQLRGNKALNLYSRLCGYVSYQALKVKSSGFDAAENKPIGCITQERFPFMIGVLMREPQFVSETVAEKVLINMLVRNLE